MINDMLCDSLRFYFGWNIKSVRYDVLVYDLKQEILNRLKVIICSTTIIDSPLTLPIYDDYTVSIILGDSGLKQMSVVDVSSQQEHEVEEDYQKRKHLHKLLHI